MIFEQFCQQMQQQILKICFFFLQNFSDVHIECGGLGNCNHVFSNIMSIELGKNNALFNVFGVGCYIICHALLYTAQLDTDGSIYTKACCKFYLFCDAVSGFMVACDQFWSLAKFSVSSLARNSHFFQLFFQFFPWRLFSI